MTSKSSRKACGAFCLGGFGIRYHYDNSRAPWLPAFLTRYPRPGAATRHPKRCLSPILSNLTFALLHFLFWSTEPLSLQASSVSPVPPCHHAHLPPRTLRVRYFPTYFMTAFTIPSRAADE